MLDLLIRITSHYLIRFVQLPMSLWINAQWADLRFRETSHLLRLDDYLLEDMGLRKVNGRIEAIDKSRIEPEHPVFGKPTRRGKHYERLRHAD